MRPMAGGKVTDRDSLHKLVDQLPADALAATNRALQSYQKWPPEPPPDVTTLHQRVRELFMAGPPEKVLEKLDVFGQRKKRVLGSGVNYSRDTEDCLASAHGSDGDTLVTFEIRRFRGCELEIEERIGTSIDKRKLLYSQTVKGPGGREGRLEIEFDIPSA